MTTRTRFATPPIFFPLRNDCSSGFKPLLSMCLQDVKWANYKDFQAPDEDQNPATPHTLEPGEIAEMMAGMKPRSSGRPKLRLDWDAAYAILAAANATGTK